MTFIDEQKVKYQELTASEYEEIIVDMIFFHVKNSIESEISVHSPDTYLKKYFSYYDYYDSVGYSWHGYKNDENCEENFENFMNNPSREHTYSKNQGLTHLSDFDPRWYYEDHLSRIGRIDILDKWECIDEIENQLNFERVRSLATKKIMELGVKKAKVYFNHKKAVKEIHRSKILGREIGREYEDVYILGYEVYW